MDPPDATNQMILPRPTPLQIERQWSNTQIIRRPLPSSTVVEPPKRRQPKNATKTDQEWEHQKLNIIRLLIEEDLPLKDVMRKMDEDHHFQASRKQYNTKIEKWRIGKNVKESEMRAIIRKERQRKMEYPPKDSIFRVRKHPVEPQKIARFKRDKGDGDNDIMMLDAPTPSDISCDTPKPENRVPLVQDLRVTPEDVTRQIFSPVQSMAPIKSFVSAFTPRSQMAYISPYLDFLSSNLALITNNPHLRQLQHLPPGTSSPTQPDLSHHWPSNSPRHAPRSPLYWSASNSPPTFGGYLSHSPSSSPSSSPPSDMALKGPSHTIVHIRNLFLNFIIREAETHEDQKELGFRRPLWSLVRHNIPPIFASVPCVRCLARAHLLYYFTHWDTLVCRVSLNSFFLETLIALLSVLDFSSNTDLDIAVAAVWILAREGRDEEMEGVINAITLEMKSGRLSALRTAIASLSLADIYALSGKHDYARKKVQDVLGAEFSIVGTVAIIASTANVEFTARRIVVGKFAEDILGLDCGYDVDYGLTEEGREILEQRMGANRMVDDVVYAVAVGVLRRLDTLYVPDLIEK